MATFIAICLIFNQIMDYQEEQVIKEWKVDYHKTEETILAEIDIEFPNAPCRVLS